MENAYQYLLNGVDLKNGDSVVAAISGGPDSMALLHLLVRIKDKIDLKVVCAHVNHNTGRVGQLEEQQYVEEFCKNNNVIFESMVIKEYSDDNFESEARNKRYNYFEEVIKKYNAKYLLTAHHGDDLIETILMRLTRGSTLKGYSGFSKVVDRGFYKILRPFIEVTKVDLIKYNEENNIHYYVDSTNLEDIHTRNRFRKYILPELKNENINVHEKFYKFSKMLVDYSDYIDGEVEKVISKLCFKNEIYIKEFIKLDKVICIKIIQKVLNYVYQDDVVLINDNHVDAIYNLIANKNGNGYIYLPSNLKAIKSYNSLRIIAYDLKHNDYEIEIEKETILPNGHIIQILDECELTGNEVCYLNSNEVKLPLKVRNRKNGDKMVVKNMEGHKKINSIFIDSKIDLMKRDIFPIVVDSNDEIVWLPNLKKSKFDKTKSKNYDIILKYN